MRIRPVAVVSATAAALLAGTACGGAAGGDAVPAAGLESWASDVLPAPSEDGFSGAGITGSEGGASTVAVADVPPGWYSITSACAPVGSATGSARVLISGENGDYGDGDCSTSPVTTTIYFGASADAPPESITLTGEADGGDFYWGASVSPTTAPE